MLAIMLTLVPIFGIMLIGAFSERQQLLPTNTAQSLNQFIYWFGLPPLLFYLIASTKLNEISLMALFSFALAMMLTQILVILFLTYYKISYRESVMAGMLSCSPNTSFMGLSAISLLFPDNASTLALAGLIATVPTITFIFTDLTVSIDTNKDNNRLAKKIIKALYTNPQLLAVTFGIIVGPLGFGLHNSLLEIARMLGNTAAPCALFCMGINLYNQLKSFRIAQTNIKERQKNKLLLITIVFTKLALMPLIAFPLLLLFNVDSLSMSTTILMAALPTAVICNVLAYKNNILIESSANALLIGTAISIVSLPLIIYILEHLL